MESRTSVKFCGQKSFIRSLQIPISLIILCTVSAPTRSQLIQSQPSLVHSLPAIVSIIKVCVCESVCDAVPVQSCLSTLPPTTDVTPAAFGERRASMLLMPCSRASAAASMCQPVHGNPAASVTRQKQRSREFDCHHRHAAGCHWSSSTRGGLFLPPTSPSSYNPPPNPPAATSDPTTVKLLQPCFSFAHP